MVERVLPVPSSMAGEDVTPNNELVTLLRTSPCGNNSGAREAGDVICGVMVVASQLLSGGPSGTGKVP